MSEITLVSGMPSMHAVPIRRLAGYVKQHTNYNVNLVMWIASKLPAKSSWQEGNEQGFQTAVMDELMKLVAGSDVVGLSVYSFSEQMADQITTAIKRLYPEKILLWGGLLPTVAPDHCVEKADFICVGEGERSLAAFLQTLETGGDLYSVGGIWGQKDGQVISNLPVPLVSELDELGFPEYLIENSYCVVNGQLRPLTHDLERRLVDRTLWAVVTQGCPHKCSYCAASALTKVSPRYGVLRRHSVDGLIDYMKRTKEKLDLRAVYFVDDLFPEMPLRVIKDLSQRWKEEIRMPFHVLGLFPKSFSEQKFHYLMDAGLRRVRTGIQSGSDRLRREQYKRRYTNEEIVELSRKIGRRSTPMSLSDYDFIMDNPWETVEEKIEGLRLLSQMEPPFTLNCYHFTVMPRTELAERGHLLGLEYSDLCKDKNDNTDPVHNDPTYINFLYFLYMIVHIPPFLLNYLVSDKVVKRDIRIPRCIFRWILFLKDLRTVYYRVRDQDPTNMPWFLSPLVLRRYSEGRIGKRGIPVKHDPNLSTTEIKESVRPSE